LVVSVNGRDLATMPGSGFNQAGWVDVPIPDGLLREQNEVVIRAIGEPNGHPDWVAIGLDTTATTRFSSWSNDDGATYVQDDLSPDSGVQTGEYQIRIGPARDPSAVAKAEDFDGKLTVRPAKDVEVRLRMTGEAPIARLLSPDGPQQTVAPSIESGLATYRVPEVPIYSVLVLPMPPR